MTAGLSTHGLITAVAGTWEKDATDLEREADELEAKAKAKRRTASTLRAMGAIAGSSAVIEP